MKTRPMAWLVMAIFATTLVASGCGSDSADKGTDSKKKSSTSSKKKKRVAFPADKATATISGTVMFDGEKPKRKKLLIQGDDFCIAQNAEIPLKEDAIIGDDGAVQNVFVYVKKGAAGWNFEPPTTAVRVIQKGCIYVPHVFGVQVGQPVEFQSSDDTTHNVHFSGEKNADFNKMQKLNQTDTTTFKRPEVMAKVKCDIHSWMEAHVGILYHPFFNVTGADGSFTLPKLPAGKYQIEAWHEKFGTKTKTLEVKDGESTTISFKFMAK